MLLDEPTEGLDAETEQQILALLREIATGKTLIMVTHRLRGLAHFDQICVLDDGQLIEQETTRNSSQNRGATGHFSNALRYSDDPVLMSTFPCG